MKYLKYYGFIFLFIGTALCSSAQKFSISGKVVDGATNTALAKATVYINNSTRGTAADENGFFVLSGLSAGTYEVVVSFVGYTPLLTQIRITNSDYKADFLLRLEHKELREVLVITNSTRMRYLDLFKKNVIGFTFDAEKCIIKNIEAIQFIQGKYKDDVQAVADEELEIENPVLGYIIYFKIVDVFFNTKSNDSHFYGYTRFVDLMENGQKNNKWVRNRRNAYLGSSQHFFRSLVRKQLFKEGFIISIDENDLNTQRESNLTVQSSGDYASVSSTNFSSAAMVKNLSEDSILILHQKDGYNIYELQLEKRLFIKYRRNSDLKLQISRVLHLKADEIGTFTALRLRRAPVLLDENGIILTLSHLFFDGIWAYERMANMLPEDYEP